MNGFLLVNKPEGITSYDVIRRIKTYCPKNTKIGHSGTLDPFAKGLLIIAIGRKYGLIEIAIESIIKDIQDCQDLKILFNSLFFK